MQGTNRWEGPGASLTCGRLMWPVVKRVAIANSTLISTHTVRLSRLTCTVVPYHNRIEREYGKELNLPTFEQGDDHDGDSSASGNIRWFRPGCSSRTHSCFYAARKVSGPDRTGFCCLVFIYLSL
jgi:hypothetical protein